MSWANAIKGAINQVKDSGASVAIAKWLSRELQDYGELLDFKLNTHSRSVELHVHLKGDRDRLTVHIDGYDLVSHGGHDYIVVKQARASREWVNAVLRNFLVNKKHKIPEQYSGMVKMVLNS